MKKALVIIDIQKGFMNKITSKIPSKIQAFIETHKKDYALIIFTQYVNHKDSNFVKNLNWKGFMTAKENAIVDELKGLINSKNLFVKYTYGSFVDDTVLNVLKKNKIKQVDIAGIDTENCVLTFARDAFDRGFSIRVLKDLSASHSSPKLHKAALEIIENNIGQVV